MLDHASSLDVGLDYLDRKLGHWLLQALARSIWYRVASPLPQLYLTELALTRYHQLIVLLYRCHILLDRIDKILFLRYILLQQRIIHVAILH